MGLRWWLAVAVVFLVGCAHGGQKARPLDVLITNARIVDGAGNPWFYGDIGIRGGKIDAIGNLAGQPAKQTLDAHHLVAAPGFIDVHTHVDADVLHSPLAENFIRDGVTTIVCGNCGGSVSDVGTFFARMEKKGAAINVATLIGHNTILNKVGDKGAQDLSPQQMAQAKAMVRQAMLDGAVGMSTGLIYTPGMYSSTEEIVELQKVAAGYGGIYATHMRSEGMSVLGAIDEALRVGREANCRVEISHFKLSTDASHKLGGSDRTLARVYAARADGQEVWLDQYPYTASSTTISTLLPDWVMENGRETARQILDDPEQVKRILGDMRQTYEVQRGRTSMAYVVIASARGFPNLAGRNLVQVAQYFKQAQSGAATRELLTTQPAPTQVTMQDQYRAAIEIIKNGGASCVFHSMEEGDVANILKNPLVSIASDSGIRSFGTGMPHPRGYGTNARVLGRYVREKKLITLEDAVRKMTSLPATAFRFKDRGLLRVGYAADIVLFDPNKITDKATFEQPHQYAQGIEHMFVNGVAVIRDAQLTHSLPGEPIRGPAYVPRAIKLSPADAPRKDDATTSPSAPEKS
jgi:N-acyl-D-amino-acid deacylase